MDWMKLCLSIAVFTCWTVPHGIANPIAIGHPAYIASESLVVKIGSDSTHIEGFFEFQSLSNARNHLAEANLELSLPIWIPNDPKKTDPATAKLLGRIKAGTTLGADIVREAYWTDAIDATLTADNRAVPIASLAVLPDKRSKGEYPPPAYMIPAGYHCLNVIFSIPPPKPGAKVLITIRYKQPLLSTRKGREFYYVPVFDMLPNGSDTKDLERYSMTLQNASTGKLAFSGYTVLPGFQSKLPLVDGNAIRINLVNP